jgi:putative oxygen-independent coproporphyrinogen III oxidase
MAGPPAFGIYVHVPFCRFRCDYCAFATYTDRDGLMERYAAACATEVSRARDDEGIPPATSVYFGGGTPSRLPAELLVTVLGAIPRADRAEVTVECNPEDVTVERLTAYRSGGVTRISLGVQSTVPHVLGGLGRRHGTEQALEAAQLVAEAGFPSWSMDLIMGGAGETDADWGRSLTDLLSLRAPPPHVSAYALTVEPGTPLAATPDRHPDDDTLADRYAMADAVLGQAGMGWEEISNWALPGHRCRHNNLYWEQVEYRGIGSAAHSHRGGRRWWNVRTPERYLAAIDEGRSATAAEEVLTGEQQQFEGLALALRTPTGVPADVLPDRPELAGLVARRDGRAVLTLRGRLLANAVTAFLVVGEPTRRAGADGPVAAGTIPPYARS